jgi:hypothetical protein
MEHAGNDETHQPNAIELMWGGKIIRGMGQMNPN